MDKHEIAHILEDIALLYELKGENPFKVRAYRTAARSLEGLEDLDSVIKQKRLSEIPGIGSRIEKKILMLYRKGSLPLYHRLQKEFPPELREMMRIPTVGAARIKLIYEMLKVRSVAELKKACEEGKVRELPGFSVKTEENILKGIKHLAEFDKREVWWKAWKSAFPLLEALRKRKDVKEVEIAGSLRRKLETIGDIDIVASAVDPEPVMEWFIKQGQILSVMQKGHTKSSIRLVGGIQVDLRIVEPSQFAFALHYFTGSKDHNIKVRRLALDLGHSLNEYGMTPLDPQTKPLFGKKKKIKESDLYQALGLQYIPPELREDLGEIEAAKQNRIPKLISFDEIRGIFHCHTTDSDGHHTLPEMVEAAQAMGWEYIGISDHSKSSYQANGLDEDRLYQQIETIQKLNQSKIYSTHIFTGTECDILNDGTLDYSDEILESLDFVIISIHRKYKQDEKTMTKRLIKAIEHPLTTMVGHLTGRLLLKRAPYVLNIEKVIDAAIANQKIIELNANPYRLDMDWRFWHRASEKGLLCSINPDAHHIAHLQFVQAGINTARKGWLTKDNVLNAWPLKKVKIYLKKMRG